MAKTNEGKKAGAPKNAMPHFLVKRLSEGLLILALTLSAYVFLTLWTYNTNDPAWTHVSYLAKGVKNAGGHVGAYLSDTLYFFFGYFAFFIPVALSYFAWRIHKDHLVWYNLPRSVLIVKHIALVLLIAGGSGLLTLYTPELALDNFHNPGGIVGQYVAYGLGSALNGQGALLLLASMFLIGVTWLSGFSWIQVVDWTGYAVYTGTTKSAAGLMYLFKNGYSLTKREKSIKDSQQPTVLIREKKIEKQVRPKLEAPLIIEPEVVAPAHNPVKALPVRKSAAITFSGSMPDLDLLDKGTPGKPLGGFTHEELENLSRQLEQHLLDFGIHADVVAVHPGPVITRFELQLAAGIKVSKLTALAKDLARALSVTSVRVVEVIPGKTVVGLELPNQNRQVVRLSEILTSDTYQSAHSPLTVALGVDIAGYPMVVDLAKMPHLLVAGTTGSGKSVGINAMILSLLYKASPEQVRLIMVDPKMLELSVYDGIPHLLTPVVTDMKEAASALRWCVGEMERRYKLMAAMGVRNISGYNTRVQEAQAAGEPLTDPLWRPLDGMADEAPLLTTLPYVVVIIDELADMMMVVGKKVEQLIARIAQKARAAGIHLVLATQRPSVDVLTGLIKSNIPTRISFQVSSKIDSRTILDQQGAEQLLGHGDMLYLAPGTGAPLRVHGALVEDEEVHRVASDWRARGEPEYIDEITSLQGEGFDGEGDGERQDLEDNDPLYDEAVEFVLQSRKASISSVQRRLKIGYNRAARLIEEMERTGIVGPLEGGVREVLVSSVTEN